MTPASHRPLARRLRRELQALLLVLALAAMAAFTIGKWATLVVLAAAAGIGLLELFEMRAWFKESVRQDLEKQRLEAQVRLAGVDVLRAAGNIERASAAMAAGADEQTAALDAIVRRIEALGQRAQEVNPIVEMISEIASQTDMLALNAAIEATRAGPLGKGFGIVAEEVRKLAERSSSATKDIGSCVEGIRQATDEVGRATEGVRRVTRTTARGAGETLDSAREMLAAARTLDEALGRIEARRRANRREGMKR